MIVAGTHDTTLVILSILIAMFASYTALDLAGRVRAWTGWVRRLWLTMAAVAMGGGIWSMHFVAMLAFKVPSMTVSYDPGLTILSLLVAIVVTGAAFVVMSQSRGSLGLLLAAGMFMGLGVVAMHYMGMAAMRMTADLRYDRLWLATSILIAVGAATAALWLAARNTYPAERAVAAIVMGFAIAGMHYAGMRAAIFRAHPGVDMAEGLSSINQMALAVAVSATTFTILFLSWAAAMFDRRLALLAQREAEALVESEERFRSLYRGTPLPLQSLDREGRIEQVSNAWLDLTGYDEAEVLGRPFADFLTKAAARQLLETDWPKLIEQDGLDPREYRIVTKDGGYRDIVSTIKIERDADGAFIHVLGGLTDVTEHRHAEEALRQAQKIEAIGQLTGGIAHDFNNLLAVVVGNLELLRKHLSDDPKAMRLVDSALEGAHRGASLTQRLLAFARRQDLRPAAVDVPGLVRSMTDLLQRSLGPAVRVQTHFPLNLPSAQVDANQLEMALLNVAVNARDAMPQGGTLDISAEEAIVDPGSEDGLAPGRYLCLSLTDTGMGMDAETLARAVDPFFTTKGVGKGTGLGLSMVQGLAAQSGGKLLLRSDPGKGTGVDLYLPVAGLERREQPVTALSPEPGPLRSILVVDDDRLVLANTAAMLEDLGHELRLAGSGEDALAQIDEGLRPDLLLTDQLMPSMTGLQLIQAARQRLPDLRCLLMSGFAEFRAEEAENRQVLAKPFTQAQLAGAVREATGSARVIQLRRHR
ncbi:MAG TPA: MHYT domain-containing protein [Sphingomonas sp.]|nr:MHYT domain-containing protein [Sphingomonas sp.]